MPATSGPTRRARLVLIAGIFLGALVTGAWLLDRGARAAGALSLTRFQATRLFEQVYEHSSADFVDSLGDSALYRKAVDGMLYELHDSRSLFLPTARFNTVARLSSEQNGAPDVGMDIDLRDGILLVIAPLPGSVAERAGILPDDRITRIDAKSTEGWTLTEAVTALNGKPGTPVQIEIDRYGAPKPLKISLLREDPRRLDAQRSALVSDGIGYVGVASLDDSTGVEATRSIQALIGHGMRALVLDLRGNASGSLESGARLAEVFLNAGQQVAATRGRLASDNRSYTDSAPQPWPSLPVTILVDGQTANGAEIVAGALQDHDRAALLGRQTYGAGSVQSALPLSEGGGMVLTTARWFTPSGRMIGKPAIDDEDEDALHDYRMDQKKKFRTDAGRSVYGVGGVQPDVLVGDSIVSPVEFAFAQKLGTKTGQFEDELRSFALDLKSRHAVTSPDFLVTPAMLDELWKRLSSHGTPLDRTGYEQAQPLVTRMLGYEIARDIFGVDTEFRRRSTSDAALAEAVRLMRGVTNEKELLNRAAQSRTSADSVASR